MIRITIFDSSWHLRIGYNRFETSAVWFETMEKQLLLNSVEVVERKTNCVFLLSLCGSFDCTLATPVLIFERGAKIFFRCISAKHHTSHNVCLEGSLFHHSLTSQPCWCPLRWKSAHGKTCRCIFRTALDLVVFVVRFLFLLSSMRRYNSSATNCVERVAFIQDVKLLLRCNDGMTCQPILIEKRPHMLRGAILLRFLSQSIWRIFLPFLNKPRHTSLVNLHVLFSFFHVYIHTTLSSYGEQFGQTVENIWPNLESSQWF